MLTNTLHFKTVAPDLISAYASRLHSEATKGEVGYYHLPKLGKATINRARALKNKQKNIQHIVVIGIGGSSLGTKAVANMLLHKQAQNTPKLHFLENLDPWSVENLLKSISLKESFFFIVSKSGSTIETLSLTKVIMSKMRYTPSNLEFSNQFGVITDEDSPLDKFAKEFNLETFHIPQNVGGRFSVLSAAGLVPLYLCGFDTEALLEGADACKHAFVDKTKNQAILQKAYRYAIHKQASINILFSYGDAFREFNAWYTQLWAESLGKKNGYARIGLTPIGLIGSVDQHSFLQLIMEGPRDKTITFLRIKDWTECTPVPNLELPYLDNVNYSNGLSLGSVLNAQCSATMQSVIQEGITTDIIELDTLDAWHVGYLMYYYEVLTSTCGLMLGINTYDQPGVEVGKRILKNILGTRR
jgi:glucose-6-phosphate isomerase